MVSSSSSYLTNTIAIGVCILLIISQRHVSYAFTTQLAPLSQQQSVAVSQHHQQTKLFTSSTTVQPTSTSTIGTVGSGYLPILLAKLAAHRSHGKSWIICPSADVDLMQQLTSLDGYDKTLSNLELVPASNTDRVEELLSTTDAIFVASDDVDTVIDPSILNYLLDPNKCTQLKRICAMSRNLNGSGMGMFVTASKKAANAQVWDNYNKNAYIEYEKIIQDAASKCKADYTIVRAGTLKGGGPGDTSNEESTTYGQYLHESYYEATKTDIITWQLLFDCKVRGVKLTKGDILPGPGMKAVFCATGSEEHNGDSGRCGVAEAMVRSLELENCANVNFGVGTIAGREVPNEEEWKVLFDDCLSS